MKIEKIDVNNVRVELTAGDLRMMDLDIADLKNDSARLRIFLFRLMQSIKEQTGFDPYNGRVMVEAVPNRGEGGGIVLLVKKVKLKKVTAVKKEKKSTLSSIENIDIMMYEFRDFGDLCGALERMSRDSLLASVLYKMKKGYCILLHRDDSLKKTHKLLREYASGFRNGINMDIVMEEYGKNIASGERLASMAEGIRSLSANDR